MPPTKRSRFEDEICSACGGRSVLAPDQSRFECFRCGELLSRCLFCLGPVEKDRLFVPRGTCSKHGHQEEPGKLLADEARRRKSQELWDCSNRIFLAGRAQRKDKRKSVGRPSVAETEWIPDAGSA